MKKLTQQFQTFLTESGISASLFLIMIKLTGVNMYSLYYVLFSQHSTQWMWIIAFFGSLAFSIPTVVVMQKNGHVWLKRLLPVLDGLLVLFGFNLKLIEHISAGDVNYISVVLSLIFAIFTGVITYSLGQINHEEGEEMVSKTDYDEIANGIEDLIIANINAVSDKDSEIKSLEEAYLEAQEEKDIALKMMEASENSRKIAETSINCIQPAYDKYKLFYLEKRAFYINQKKEENRTDEDRQILEELEWMSSSNKSEE